MAAFITENPLFGVFLISGLIANLICLPGIIKNRAMKTLSDRVIQKALQDGTIHTGTLVKKKFHRSYERTNSNGRSQGWTQEYYTAWYRYAYRMTSKIAKVTLPKYPPDEIKLYYRKGHPFKVYAAEAFAVRGAKYNWMYIRTFVWWAFIYFVLYVAMFGKQLWMEALQKGI